MCMAWVSTAPLRPCAARAALPGQARSHICFGPVMSGPLPGPPFLFGLGLGQGRQAHGLGFSSVLETVRRPRGASRARARRPPRSYICFGPIMSVGLPGPPCWFALGLGQGHQVHGLGFYSVLETVRRPRGASRARARRPPRSYICFGPVMPVPLPGPPCLLGCGSVRRSLLQPLQRAIDQRPHLRHRGRRDDVHVRARQPVDVQAAHEWPPGLTYVHAFGQGVFSHEQRRFALER